MFNLVLDISTLLALCLLGSSLLFSPGSTLPLFAENRLSLVANFLWRILPPFNQSMCINPLETSLAIIRSLMKPTFAHQDMYPDPICPGRHSDGRPACAEHSCFQTCLQASLVSSRHRPHDWPSCGGGWPREAALPQNCQQWQQGAGRPCRCYRCCSSPLLASPTTVSGLNCACSSLPTSTRL